MAHQSFSKTVLETLKEAAIAGRGEVTAGDLSSLLFLQTRKAHKKMLNTLSDLSRAGRITRVRQGVYSPASSGSERVGKQEVMWRVLRMRRVATVADLQEMAGVSPHYAMEWLRLLVKRELAVKIVPPNKNTPHSWRLIQTEQPEMPVNTKKAAELRKLRRAKKGMLSVELTKIEDAVQSARNLIKDMEEGE